MTKTAIIALYLFLLTHQLGTLPVLDAFLLDKDTRDDCAERVAECTSTNDEAFYQRCPVACSQYLSVGLEGSIRETTLDPEANYYTHKVMTSAGKSLPIEDLVEGYVTVFAITPILEPNSGMAQFYYEMLDHVANTIGTFGMQTFLLPIYMDGDKKKKPAKMKSNPIEEHEDNNKKSSGRHRNKVIVLQEATKETIPTVLDEFVFNTKPLTAEEDEPRIIPNDRVSIYIVSAHAKYVERLVSPTMRLLEERLLVYLNELNFEEL